MSDESTFVDMVEPGTTTVTVGISDGARKRFFTILHRMPLLLQPLGTRKIDTSVTRAFFPTRVSPQKAGARPKKLSPAQLKKLAALFRTALRKEVAQMKRKPAARR
jgi:hypothetical protein